MEKKQLTKEKMEARGILDNDSLYNGPAEYSDIVLFMQNAAELAKEANTAAAGYGFTKNGAILYLCWAFFQMGVWKGCEEYRGFLIEWMNDECGMQKVPEDMEDMPFQLIDPGMAGLIEALDSDHIAKDIFSQFELDIWEDDSEKESFEEIACARDEDIIAREILFGLTDGIVGG